MFPSLSPVLVALAVVVTLPACASFEPEQEEPLVRPRVVATWSFGKTANDRAIETLLAGGTALDAVEQGVRAIETLSSDGSVGLGGRPNAAGYVQLDACIMDGPAHRAGSVAGVEGIVHPITAARRVMEDSRHVMLVGEGARWFALERGLESVDISGHQAMKRAWLQRDAATDGLDGGGHDTIALLVLDHNGDIAGGCSTSGASNKLPGRVGDSPILGAGLYVDNEVGAAGATGLGENMMRHCATFLIVELMRQGLHPQAACEEVVHRMAQTDPLGYELSACFIALDKQGRYGAATSNQGFPFAMATQQTSEVLRVEQVARRR